MKILLIGPQGAGKSTQARLLSEYLKVPVVSTGEIFRRLAQKKAGIGELIKGILEQGQLVDDQTASSIVRETVSLDDCRQGFVMDGYPRNLDQLKLFDPGFDIVFYLNVEEPVVIDRLLKRGRIDDTEASIKKRLTLYYQQTQPLLDHYRKQGILVEIEGTRDIARVQDDIRSKIKQ